MGIGGDVFLLDMGESIKIKDLAKQMIRLSGFKAVDEQGNGDIEIQFTGLRSGEKLYEELLINQNNVSTTKHERIFKSFEAYYSVNEIRKVFDELKSLSTTGSDTQRVINILISYVEGYMPKSNQIL